MQLTRRDLAKLASALPLAGRIRAAGDSHFGGVTVGVIAPYSFQNMTPDVDAIVKTCADLGISGVELQNNPVEAYAGAPQSGRGGFGFGGPGGGPGGPGGGRGPGGGGPPAGAAAGGPPPGAGGPGGGPPGRGGRAPLTPEQQETQRKSAEALKAFRLSASMDKFKEVRQKFNGAGIDIYAYKFEYNLAPLSDEEFDYSFTVASTLGASHVTLELPNDPALTKRIGDFAATKKMNVGYHAHQQASLTAWDVAMSQSKYNGINLDVGHYTMANNAGPIPVIQKHHDRIVSMHLKDRKFQSNGGQNMPWGQGDTPLKEILQLVKAEKWKFPCTIELEYRVEGSNAVAEVGKCLQFAKDALA
jgi:sugar phosphate isomerase/epimerase